MELSRWQGGTSAAATGRVIIIVPPRRERRRIPDLPAPLTGVPHLLVSHTRRPHPQTRVCRRLISHSLPG